MLGTFNLYMKNTYFLVPIVFALGFMACQQTQSNAQTQANTQTQANAQTRSKSFSKMTEQEKADFVAGKIDEITLKISGKKYSFDADFKAQVSNYIESYAKRIGSNRKTGFGQDLEFVLRRGAESAPTINAVFDKQGVSRLSGLYIAMIETEFDKDLVSPTGSSGVFGLTAAQAKKYGMTKKDLTDLSKAAEVTARLILENQKKFESDNMKEFLAVLSHNRDPGKIDYDVNRKMMDEYRQCSICGMTKNASALDEQFQAESVKYIPKFLAAAIIGENPNDFGLSAKPLSTLGTDAKP